MKSFNDDHKKIVAGVLSGLLNNVINTNNCINDRLIGQLIWSATADLTKMDSHKYKVPIWSQAAINSFQNNGIKGLRHEHIYPKRLVINDIRSLSSKNLKSIFDVLCNFAHAAIITKEEDDIFRTMRLSQTIPQRNFSCNLDKLFSRYLVANIDLKFVDIKNNNFNTGFWYVQNKQVCKNFIHNNLINLV